jgi:hypothetical protein
MNCMFDRKNNLPFFRAQEYAHEYSSEDEAAIRNYYLTMFENPRLAREDEEGEDGEEGGGSSEEEGAELVEYKEKRRRIDYESITPGTKKFLLDVEGKFEEKNFPRDAADFVFKRFAENMAREHGFECPRTKYKVALLVEQYRNDLAEEKGASLKSSADFHQKPSTLAPTGVASIAENTPRISRALSATNHASFHKRAEEMT